MLMPRIHQAIALVIYKALTVIDFSSRVFIKVKRKDLLGIFFSFLILQAIFLKALF